MEENKLIELLTSLNFIIPSIIISSICYLKCKYSGIPKREEYKSRL